MITERRAAQEVVEGVALAPDARQAVQMRWVVAAQLIAVMRSEPGITRTAAAQRLGLSSGGAAELTARLRRARLLDESPAPVQGRGRPTTVLGPHHEGPLVVAVDVRSGDWGLALAGIDGEPVMVHQGGDGGEDPELVQGQLAKAIGAVHRREPRRIRAIAVSVAGPVSGAKLGQFVSRGWNNLDLSGLTAEVPKTAGVSLILGNDATLAGLAESRTGAARSATTALHLIVSHGLGGALVVSGEPVGGAHGAAGEYGHIPFADLALVCPCGARGCWGLTIDGRALARHRGDAPPQDPAGYVRDLVGQKHWDARTRLAFDAVGGALGRGIGGLVNLHDPDVVTIGGVAPLLRAAARRSFDAAYIDGLMDFRKSSPPRVLDSVHGQAGPLLGALALAIDHITTSDGLADWAERQRR